MGKKGEKLRPCPRCSMNIRFVRWIERAEAEKKNIWHWVNENGAHHYCGSRFAAADEVNKQHIRSIQEGAWAMKTGGKELDK